MPHYSFPNAAHYYEIMKLCKVDVLNKVAYYVLDFEYFEYILKALV